MKQNISTDQLNEFIELKVNNGIANLNFEKQGKLNKLLGIESERNYPPAHLIDIGKMIEILHQYDCDVSIYSAGAMWHVEVAAHINVQEKCLCDALWQAVKEVL